MKTNRSILCVAILLLAACGERAGDSNQQPADTGGPRGTDGGFLLTTELPPELIEGTPKPIIIPGVTPLPRPRPIPAPMPAPAPPTARPVATVNQAPAAAVPVPPAARPHPAADHPAPEAAFPDSPSLLPPGHLQPPPVDRERYGQLVDNPWQAPVDAPLSTFSIDVDTASYSNLRDMTARGARIPRDSVRLEEIVNYFDYAYAPPTGEHPFAVHIDNAACPWNPDNQLVRVALKGREIDRSERAPANLVFLLDVSGSMRQANKLPLVIGSFQLLLEELNPSDTITIVVYAGSQGVALPPTVCDAAGRDRIASALQSLQAGGSTNGAGGIQLAYQLAREHFKPGGINRVILATDGDFNVGVTDDGGLVGLVERNAKSKIFFTVLGFGRGNLNDGMLEAITNKGNGTYHYIDGMQEARRVFLDKMMGTLVTIAKDVKIQVELNPARVRRYRLLGYANRMLRKEDFSNDKIDAGDIGSGHTVTAFYEVETGDGSQDPPVEELRYQADPRPAPEIDTTDASAEWLTVKLRYKQPEEDHSSLIEVPFTGLSRELAAAGSDFRFAASAAMTAMLLRDAEGLESSRFDHAAQLAADALGEDPDGLRREFAGLVQALARQQR